MARRTGVTLFWPWEEQCAANLLMGEDACGSVSFSSLADSNSLSEPSQ
jgi:hypothetical protein